MICKWCGMESVEEDTCSWCGKSLGLADDADHIGSQPEPASEPAAPQVAAAPEAPAKSPVLPWAPAPRTLSRSAQAGGGPVRSPSAAQPAALGARSPVAAPSQHRAPAPAIPLPSASHRMSSPSASVQSAPRAGAKGKTPSIGVKRPGTPVGRRVPVPTLGISPRTPSAADAESPAGAFAPPAPQSAPDAAAALAAQAPAEVAPNVVAPESGGLAEGIVAPRQAPPPAAPGAPQMGTFQADKSKYYPGVVIDPVSGRHYNADTGMTTSQAAQRSTKDEEIKLEWDEPLRYSTVLLRFTALFAAILAIGALIAHAAPAIYAVPMLCVEFVAALLMPVMRAAPWADEDAEGVGIFVVLTIVGGPAAALMGYAAYSLVKRETNPAILGIGAIALLSRFFCGLAVGHVTMASLTPWTSGGSLLLIGLDLSGFVALAGWYCAAVFHKLDE